MLVNILYLQHDDVYTQHVKHIETHNHCTEIDLQQTKLVHITRTDH